MFNNVSELTRDGSQLWNPKSSDLTLHAQELAGQHRHANRFPPSRHCTEQFTGPAGPNLDAANAVGNEEDDRGLGVLIDFNAPDARRQIEASAHLEMIGAPRGGLPGEEAYQSEGEGKAVAAVPSTQEEQREAAKKNPVKRQIHNPYSVNKVFLDIDPETLALERREQSDYFEIVSASVRQHNLARAPLIRAFNTAGIIFMPPRPPSGQSFDVFVKGGADPSEADRLLTNMIYRWYALCSTNMATYRNWFTAVNGQMSTNAPPNPKEFTDLGDWCAEAERWWDSVFATHQGLRHHSRSAAIASGSAAPHLPKDPLASGPARGGAATTPSKRARATPPTSGATAPAPAPPANAPAVWLNVNPAVPPADGGRVAKAIGGGGANYLPHNAGVPSFKRNI